MGSWRATCGLSGLPISEGTPTKLILLTQGADQFQDKLPASGTTYPYDFWAPVVWPIDGLYDGYGLLTDIRIPAAKLFAQRLQGCRSKAAPDEDHEFLVDLGKGTLSRDTPGGERFYSGELLHFNPYGRTRPLGHMFIRSDIWDLVIDLQLNHARTSREEFRRHAEGYADELLAWLPEFKRTLKDVDHRLANEYHESWFRRQLFRHEGALWFFYLAARSPDIDRESALEALYQVADLLHMSNVMEAMRMVWAPSSGRGVYEAQWPAHIAFHRAVIQIAKDAERKDDPDFEEDELEEDDSD